MDALLDLSDMIYTVNLTKDILEKSVVLNGKDEECRELFMDYPLPCSYRDYCSEYMKMVTQETLGSYRLADDPAKLLKRFEAGRNIFPWNTVSRRKMARSAGYRKQF